MVVINPHFSSKLIQPNHTKWLPVRNCSFHDQGLAPKTQVPDVDNSDITGDIKLQLGNKGIGRGCSMLSTTGLSSSGSKACRVLAPIAQSKLRFDDSDLSEQGDVGGDVTLRDLIPSSLQLGRMLRRFMIIALVTASAAKEVEPIAKVSDWVLMKIREVSKVIGLSFEGFKEEA